MKLHLVLLLLGLNAGFVQSLARDYCEASYGMSRIFSDAQALIGGLMAMHKPGSGNYGCGSPAASGEMEAYEAVRWALQRINQDSGTINGQAVTDSYVPGIKIGVVMHDTCSRSTIADKATLDFFPDMYSQERYCNSSGSRLFLGVLGPTLSTTAASVAQITAAAQKSQISFQATSPSLSDRNKYSFFLRTIPPDNLQVKVIAELLKQMKWKYVAVVYTTDNYGTNAYQKMLSYKDEVCVTMAIPVSVSETSESVFRSVFNKLLQTSAVGVIYLGQQNTASGLMKVALTVPNAGKLQWIFPESVGNNVEFTKSLNYVRGIISVSPSVRHIPEFEGHWVRINETNPKENPWYKEWYMSNKRCRLPGVNYAPYNTMASCTLQTESQKRKTYVQNKYVEPAITAVYTFARALKNAHADRCGRSKRGLCASLLNMPPSEFFNGYLSRMDYTFSQSERVPSLASHLVEPFKSSKRVRFDANGDIVNPAFDIWNYNDRSGQFSFEKVGTYLNGRLDLSSNKIRQYDADRLKPLPAVVTSPCPSVGCKNCRMIRSEYREHAYKKGDILLGGVFSVHGQGGKVNTCGSIRTEIGAQMVEAYLYALSEVNKLTNILPGVKLGAVAFDDCSSKLMSAKLVSNFQSGSQQFKTRDGFNIDPLSVHAYLGAHDSSITMVVADLLAQMNIPLVGYASTSTALSNRIRYPLFARTVPSDDKQATVIFQLLKSFGWTYIQTVQAPNDYGRNGVAVLKKLAAKESICVSASHEFKTDGNYEEIVQKLKKKEEAKVVVVFADSTDLRNLLLAANKTGMAGNFLFIGSVVWGHLNKIVENLPKVAQGSIMLGLKEYNMRGFSQYLDNLDVNTYKENPWFKEYYQSLHSCYLDAKDNPNNYTKKCSGQKTTSSHLFKQNQFSLYTANAVYAIAYGLDQTLKSFCGTNYKGICSEFRNAVNREVTLLQNIRKASFMDVTNHKFSLVDGEGGSGYDIYNYKNGQFNKVGEYILSSKSFKLDVNAVGYPGNARPKSQCTKACPECLYLNKNPKNMHVPGDLLIGGIFDIHKQGITPFTCGDAKIARGVQDVEAMAYALWKINNGTAPVRLKGVKLGGVALDSCSSEAKASNLVSGSQSGTLVLESASGAIQTSKIVGWLSYSTSETSAIAGITGRLGLAQVSPSATTSAFSDKARFPTLYVSVPRDVHRAAAMTKLINQMGWQYVQVVYSPTTYGQTGFKVFTQESQKHKICVLSSYEIGTAGTMDDIIRKLANSPTNVVVLWVSENDLLEFIKAKKKAGSVAHKLVLLAGESLGNKLHLVKGMEDTVNNAITFKIQSPSVPDFNAYLGQKEDGKFSGNPWFPEFFETVHKCYLGSNHKYPTACSRLTSKDVTKSAYFIEGQRILSTIDSVYALADAVDRVLKVKCGPSYNGVCKKFLQDSDTKRLITQHLSNVTFTEPTGTTFKFQDRSTPRPYEIYRFTDKKYTKVGSYSDEVLRITSTGLIKDYKDVKSGCGTQCLSCLYESSMKEKFTYVSGDIVIAGLFDVSEKGNSPFTCGKINMVKGFQLLEAFNYAIGQVNSNKGLFKDKLGGITIGGVGLDTCKSPTRASTLISTLHNGFLKLTKGPSQVNPGRIHSYVGASGSDQSLAAARVLEVLKTPQVSYGATSVELQNREKFASFLRTVPADDRQARAMVALLKHFEIDYVQIVHSPGTYGEALAKEFMRIAPQNDICVSQKVNVGDQDGIVTLQSASNAVMNLLNKPMSSVVLVMIKSDHLNVFLRAVKKEKQLRKINLKFIGSEAWSTDKNVIKGVEDIAEGAVTFGMETADVHGFDLYLKGKSPNNYKTNPWFNEYYQEAFNCSLTPGSLQYPRTCQNTDKDIVQAPGYQQDPYVLYTVNAVYATALGIHKAIEKACGAGYYGLCETFRNYGDRRQRILDGIKEVKFTDATLQNFFFNKNGESNRGYHLYTITKTEVTSGNFAYNYGGVGSYNDTHLLKLAAEFKLPWKSSCSQTGACKECPTMGKRQNRYIQKPSSKGLNIIGFFDIHKSSTDIFKCGSLDIGSGLQNVMAFFYAIDSVNQNIDVQLPQSVKLGGLAIDTCGSAMRTRQDAFSMLSGDGLCNAATYQELVRPSSVVAYLPLGTPNSAAALDVVSPVGYSVVSPSATALSVVGKPGFLSTVPPDNLQANVMAEIARLFRWTYITAVVSDNEFGRSNIKTFMQNINNSSYTICVPKQPMLATSASLRDAKKIIKELDAQVGAKIVFLFTSDAHTRLLLQATKDLALQGRFIWIAGSNLGKKASIVKGLEDVTVGAVSLEIYSPIPSGFLKYLSELKPGKTKGIPSIWFDEFWQRTFKCRLDSSKAVQKQYFKPCTLTEKITDKVLAVDPNVLHTIIATYMVAQGLGNVEECKNSRLEMSGCLSQLSNRNKVIYDAIKASTWKVFPGELGEDSFEFRFNDQGYGNTAFNILNYRKQSGINEFVKIGTWSGRLRMNQDDFEFYDDAGKVVMSPLSRCPEGKTCDCPNMNNGKGGQILPQQQTPESNENFTKIWGIILCALTAFGILVSIFLFVFLLISYPVRGGTTVLGYLLLFGIMCLYAINFAFLLHADVPVCGIRRFGLGFVYALIFGCMFVKVMNTWRVEIYYKDYATPSYERLAHPCGLLLMAIGLATVQAIIGIEWLILRPPTVDHVPYEGFAFPRCAPTDFHNQELVISCVYVMFLILMCIIFSAVTWDSQENHRESRWILITSCFTVGIWFVWTIVSTLTEYKYRDPAIAIANLVNATILLLCIYIRKIYLLNKYQNEIEEEKKSQYTIHDEPKIENGNIYSTVFANNTFDNSGEVASSRSRKGSQTGSGIIYVYDGMKGTNRYAMQQRAGIATTRRNAKHMWASRMNTVQRQTHPDELFDLDEIASDSSSEGFDSASVWFNDYKMPEDDAREGKQHELLEWKPSEADQLRDLFSEYDSSSGVRIAPSMQTFQEYSDGEEEPIGAGADNLKNLFTGHCLVRQKSNNSSYAMDRINDQYSGYEPVNVTETAGPGRKDAYLGFTDVIIGNRPTSRFHLGKETSFTCKVDGNMPIYQETSGFESDDQRRGSSGSGIHAADGHQTMYTSQSATQVRSDGSNNAFPHKPKVPTRRESASPIKFTGDVIRSVPGMHRNIEEEAGTVDQNSSTHDACVTTPTTHSMRKDSLSNKIKSRRWSSCSEDKSITLSSFYEQQKRVVSSTETNLRKSSLTTCREQLKKIDRFYVEPNTYSNQQMQQQISNPSVSLSPLANAGSEPAVIARDVPATGTRFYVEPNAFFPDGTPQNISFGGPVENRLYSYQPTVKENEKTCNMSTDVEEETSHGNSMYQPIELPLHNDTGANFISVQQGKHESKLSHEICQTEGTSVYPTARLRSYFPSRHNADNPAENKIDSQEKYDVAAYAQVMHKSKSKCSYRGETNKPKPPVRLQSIQTDDKGSVIKRRESRISQPDCTKEDLSLPMSTPDTGETAVQNSCARQVFMRAKPRPAFRKAASMQLEESKPRPKLRKAVSTIEHEKRGSHSSRRSGDNFAVIKQELENANIAGFKQGIHHAEAPTQSPMLRRPKKGGALDQVRNCFLEWKRNSGIGEENGDAVSIESSDTLRSQAVYSQWGASNRETTEQAVYSFKQWEAINKGNSISATDRKRTDAPPNGLNINEKITGNMSAQDGVDGTVGTFLNTNGRASYNEVKQIGDASVTNDKIWPVFY